MKKIRIISLVIFAVAAVVNVDLLINLLGNLIPEINDGLSLHTVLLPAKIFFGDSLWSLERFYNSFVISALITLAIFIENIVLAVVNIIKK